MTTRTKHHFLNFYRIGPTRVWCKDGAEEFDVKSPCKDDIVKDVDVDVDFVTSGGGSDKPAGTQFITGSCANDGECASGCCGFNFGKCAGPIIAQERDDGCGFSNSTPNDDAARKLRDPK